MGTQMALFALVLVPWGTVSKHCDGNLDYQLDWVSKHL